MFLMIKKFIFNFLKNLLFFFGLRLEIYKAQKSKKKNINLPHEYQRLQFSNHALFKLINEYNFKTCLDIGSGEGLHTKILLEKNKIVTSIDLGFSSYNKGNYKFIKGDFINYNFKNKFDCIFASHVLEHQPNLGLFLKKCIKTLKKNGILCITVPPLKHRIVSGHINLFNPGLLIYQMCFNGLDMKSCSVLKYDYNISIIVKKKIRPKVKLAYDTGDIKRLQKYLPKFFIEGVDGQIDNYNW
jgi:SAM-dependent methyltransferase